MLFGSQPFNCIYTYKKAVMVGPDKPVISGQRLFPACYLSSAGNTHTCNLSGTPPSFIYIRYTSSHFFKKQPELPLGG